MPARFLFSILCGVMSKPEKVMLLRTTGVAVSLSAEPDELPRRIKILNWGDNPNCHGSSIHDLELSHRYHNRNYRPLTRKQILTFI